MSIVLLTVKSIYYANEFTWLCILYVLKYNPAPAQSHRSLQAPCAALFYRFIWTVKVP